MNDVLASLFGSTARVKILRLFLSNLDSCYTAEEVIVRSKVHPQTARKELNLFTKIGLLKKQDDTRMVVQGRGKNKKEAKKKVVGFAIDNSFADLLALRNFILNIQPTDDNGILKKIKSVGKIKLVIVSGVFIRDTDSRIDILVVGDSLSDSRLKAAIRDLESHMGRELRYAAFATSDFTYRLGVYDRLIRDVLDYPHQIVVDKLAPAWKDVHMRKIGKPE